MAVRQLPYPDEPGPVDPGQPVPESRIISGIPEGTGTPCSILLPPDYNTTSGRYPLILALHDRSEGAADQETRDLLAQFNTLMAGNQIPLSLVAEIPVSNKGLSDNELRILAGYINSTCRTINDPKRTIILGNGQAGELACKLLPGLADLTDACLLFDATLPDTALPVQPGISYYLDICDQGAACRGYHAMFMSLRASGADHEYRVRQGTATHASFLAGLAGSSSFMNQHLLN